ncbi:MAG: phosphate ABC transporter permease subunit PstC [Bacteroidota bacterium]
MAASASGLRKHGGARGPDAGPGLRRRFRLSERIAEALITGVAFTSLAAIVLIFLFVFREAIPLFGTTGSSPPRSVVPQVEESYGEEYLGGGSRALEAEKAQAPGEKTPAAEGEGALATLLSVDWQPVSGHPRFGLLPLVLGTLKVTLLAVLIASPLAILSALFTASFAPRKLKEVIKPAIELLAAFPSVVIGFFALVTLASVLQGIFGFQYRLNALVGGMAMSLAVIPIVYTVAEDSLAAVPRPLGEGSLALGASRWQTALFVTLPAATPGIFAAVLLGFGRAFGETMIVLMATGNAPLAGPGLLEPVRTMSASIGAEMAEVIFGDTHYHVLFLLGALLFLFTFGVHAVAEGWIRQRLLRRFRGEP